MTRETTLALLMCAFCSLPASAQALRPQPPVTVDQLRSPTGLELLTRTPLEQAPRQVPRPVPPPPPPADTPRRRGSMVGYIEDPVVSSKVRIRYEGGWHNPTPDRAEFFYAKCGCYRDLDPTAPEYDPDAPGPRPGAASDVNFKQLYFMGEFAASDQLSVFAELPIRWLQPQSFIPGTGAGFENQAGIGDIRAGARFGVVSRPGSAVTAQVKFFFPSGDPAKGLGTDHGSIEPAFLVYHELSGTIAVEGQVAVLAPFGGSAGVPTATDDNFSGTVFSYGVGPSVVVYQSSRMRVAPVVEFLGWHVSGGFQTAAPQPGPAGADTFNVKIGGRMSWLPATDGAPGHSLYIGYGKALTDAKWYDDILRVEYRLSF